MKRTFQGRAPGPTRFHSVADYEIDMATGELRREGRPVPLRPQAACVLALLVGSYPRTVTHDELRAALWGSAAVEWETGIHQIVRQLRRVLRDDPRDPVFIETVHRRGYRFRPRPLRSPEPRRGVPAGVRRGIAIWVAGALSLPVALLVVCALAAP